MHLYSRRLTKGPYKQNKGTRRQTMITDTIKSVLEFTNCPEPSSCSLSFLLLLLLSLPLLPSILLPSFYCSLDSLARRVGHRDQKSCFVFFLLSYASEWRPVFAFGEPQKIDFRLVNEEILKLYLNVPRSCTQGFCKQHLTAHSPLAC